VFSKPTVVNNVETLSNLPYIIEVGGEAYAKIGTPDCPAEDLLASAVMWKSRASTNCDGTKLKDIIYTHCGGIKGGKKLKA